MILPQSKRPVRSSCLLLLLCLLATSAQSQDKGNTRHRASFNYGFVSPNTRDDLNIDEAINAMKSPEESRLIKQAINLGCVIRSKIRAVRALGSWSDGAENSILLRVKTDEASIRYLLSRMGRDAQQKSVLYFHPQPAGVGRIYRLRPRRATRNLKTLAATLERNGIAFRTLVPDGKNTSIYVVDPDRTLHAKVMKAAKRLRAWITYEAGNAAFVGDNHASQARVVFEREIKDYETRHPNLPSTCDIQQPPKSRKELPGVLGTRPGLTHWQLVTYKPHHAIK